MQDAVIVSAVRTAVGKAPRGRLSQVRPDEMGAVVIAEALKRAGPLDPALVEDVDEVGGEVRVGVLRRERRGLARPVATGVEGDDAVARALERPRAHDDVALRRGETVEEDDRRPLPRVVDRQHRLVP